MKEIAKALAAAQMEMGKALKQSQNPAFRSKYADLGNVMDACMPSLNKHGIAVVQTMREESVVTMFIHESGDILECPVPLILGKRDMQGLGSAVTYARRYGLMSLAGIAPEDDDGNAAAQSPQKAQKPVKAELPPDTKPSFPDFIAWCRDQHGGGEGFGEYVAKTFIALWHKKPSEGQLRNAWDKNKASLEWLENHDKREYGHVVDGFENRMMELSKNYEKTETE
jgi:hypothetical protein